MDEKAFLTFLATAKKAGATGEAVAAVIKKATHEDIDPAQLEQLMSQMPQGAGEESPEHGMEGMHGAPGEQVAPHGHHTEQHAMEGFSPEIIEAIAAEVAKHMQGGDMAAHEQGLPPEAMQGLDMAKSAEYISGFLTKAAAQGWDMETAVNIYGNQYSKSVAILKEASLREQEVEKIAELIDEDTLAYYEGIAKKAEEMGFTYEQTLEVLKEAGAIEQLTKKLTPENK